MSKTRVYELAKTLEISNKELLVKLKEIGIEAKSHTSGLDEDAVNLALEKLGKKNDELKAEVKVESKPEVKPEPKVEVKAETKVEPKPEPKNEPKQEVKADKKQNEKQNNKPANKPENNKKEAPANNNNNNNNGNFNPNGKKKKNKKNKKNKNFNQPAPAPVVEENVEDEILEIQIADSISVKELAEKINKAPSAVIMELMKMGVMASANQEIDFETAEKVCETFDIIVEKAEEIDLLEEAFREEVDDEADLKERPPVVVVMGHVDHGKTSLLDAIRHSHVTAREAGGITQHIGAYTVSINDKPITFLDTPGHEAFTAMRMRGAQVTDIAILVVAADDGVMPQTKEAIDHAKAAGVPIVVAINKIDKEGADPERIKAEMAEEGLLPEEWGGDTVYCEISAKKKIGIEELLETLTVVAELADLKANPNRYAYGSVVEGKLDKGRGAVATLLVENGTLRASDPIVVGAAYGRVRQMLDDKGRVIKEALPGTPVEITGLNEVPVAGDKFMVFETEKQARSVGETRMKAKIEKDRNSGAALSLDDLYSQIKEGQIIDLNIIVKADVQGTAEAVKASLEKIDVDGVRVNVIRSTVGAISESDVILASASQAIIYGFNVRPDAKVRNKAEEENVEIRLHNVIYKMVEEIETAMKGMLAPEYHEVITGQAEIRQVIKASKVGNIAGCYVTDGSIKRNCGIRLIRDGIVVYEGKLASLRRFKDDVKEVNAGFECGLNIENYNDIKEGDIIEGYVMEEVEKK